MKSLVIPAKAGIQCLVGTVLLLTAACSAAPPLPDDLYYRLQLAPPAQRFDTPRVAGPIVVDRPSAASVYTSRDLAYSDSPPHLHVSHYHYHHWVDPPPQLLQQELADFLRSANLASNVTTEAGRLPVSYRISGIVRRFERQKTASGWQVAVALELRAEPADRKRPLLLQQYDTVLAAEGDGIEDTVRAFSKATGSLFDRFVSDVGKALPAEPVTARH
jgi:ABC-type uncharacterized transport system auxiliary subunit